MARLPLEEAGFLAGVLALLFTADFFAGGTGFFAWSDLAFAGADFYRSRLFDSLIRFFFDQGIFNRGFSPPEGFPLAGAFTALIFCTFAVVISPEALDLEAGFTFSSEGFPSSIDPLATSWL